MKQAFILVWEFPPGPGGIGQHAYSLASSLSKRGLIVKILTSADYGTQDEIQAFDRNHPNLIIKRLSGKRLLKYAKRIYFGLLAAFFMRNTEFIFSGKGALWLIPVMKLLSSASNRFTAFVHGSEVFLPNVLPRKYTQNCLRYANRIFCVSRFTWSLLPDSIKSMPQCNVLVNGLVLSDLPIKPVSDWSEIKLTGSPRLLTVGQLTRRKGQHRVIKALPQLRRRWPNIHYHMVGLPTDKEEIIELARSLNVLDCITIHGRVSGGERLFQAYASSEIFMMLSENQPDGDVEGFGIAILEANYFGLPAIGAKDCGIEDAILDGSNGFLVDGNDPLAIERAIELCNERRNDMRERMQEWIAKHDWDRLIEKFLI